MAKFDELIMGDVPVLVDFFATWCGPCKMMHPILEELKTKVGDGVVIIKVDVDVPANKALAARHNVGSVPTLMVFKRGKIVWRASGVHTADQLQEILKNS